MKIAIGSDHAGYNHKQKIIAHLKAKGHEVVDFGTHSTDSCDYPVYIKPTAKAVAKGECEKGIVLGGSGNGEAISANKVKGVRCALCWNEDTAKLATEHNNANVISIGERQTPIDLALKIVDAWLGATFEAGRHLNRINQLETDLD
jgi:ribose 5-phosphate isomerase B